MPLLEAQAKPQSKSGGERSALPHACVPLLRQARPGEPDTAPNSHLFAAAQQCRDDSQRPLGVTVPQPTQLIPVSIIPILIIVPHGGSFLLVRLS